MSRTAARRVFDVLCEEFEKVLDPKTRKPLCTVEPIEAEGDPMRPALVLQEVGGRWIQGARVSQRATAAFRLMGLGGTWLEASELVDRAISALQMAEDVSVVSVSDGPDDKESLDIGRRYRRFATVEVRAWRTG